MYDRYCFLPLSVFRRKQLLVSYLHPSKIDSARHAWAILALLAERPFHVRFCAAHSWNRRRHIVVKPEHAAKA